MISKFTKSIEINDDTCAIFNTLVMKVLFVTKDEWYQIQSNGFQRKEDELLLKDCGIIVESEAQDEMAFNRLRTAVINHSRKPRILYLILTTNCNLNCKYCFVENNPYNTSQRQVMDRKTCITAIDKFLYEIKDKYKESQIIFYGGEPLVNVELLKEAIKYIRDRSHDLKITVLTNGTLLTQEICLFLKQYTVGIGLSLDGPKEINDKNRIFRNSQNSVYDTLEEKIRILNEIHGPYCISATVTQDVIDNKDSVLYDFKKLGVENIFWNLFHFSHSSANAIQFYEDMTNFILSSYDLLESEGIKEGRIIEQLNLFSEGIFKFQSCGAVGLNQITVQPNGDVCICQGEQRVQDKVCGNILKDSVSEILNNPNITSWLEYYTVNRPECKQCEALFVCGGGCPLQALALSGDQSVLDGATCIFYKQFVVWLVKRFYAKYIENIYKKEVRE